MPNSEAQPEVKILKASYALKQKAGTGGFAPEAIQTAEKRLDNASEMFPTVAAADLAAIEEALKMIQKGDVSKTVMIKVYAACIELKSHGAMFKFPLVTMVAENLCHFLDTIQNVTITVREIIELHLQTLHIAVAQGPRAITEQNRFELMNGLEKACAKALEESKN